LTVTKTKKRAAALSVARHPTQVALPCLTLLFVLVGAPSSSCLQRSMYDMVGFDGDEDEEARRGCFSSCITCGLRLPF
jgi:hypothetical protein